MPRPQSESSGPTLSKSQRPCSWFQNCLAHRLLAGECPALGWWWRGHIYLHSRTKQPKTAKKRAVSRTFLLINHRKCCFSLKYLTRYTHQTFFEEYINFKIFRNLSHCGVIPVRSFGSQIRPQPHGSGLRIFNTCFNYFSYMYILRIFNKCNFFNFLAYLRIFYPY